MVVVAVVMAVAVVMTNLFAAVTFETSTTITSFQAKDLLLTAQGKKHHQVKHLGLDICDWTKRVKSYELYQHVQYLFPLPPFLPN